MKSFDAVIHMQIPFKKRLLVVCRSAFMRLVKHLTALRAPCMQMFDWSSKTRRSSSRRCRDARVYGRTTTAMHEHNDTNHPSPPGNRAPTNPFSARVFFKCLTSTSATGLSCIQKAATNGRSSQVVLLSAIPLLLQKSGTSRQTSAPDERETGSRRITKMRLKRQAWFRNQATT